MNYLVKAWICSMLIISTTVCSLPVPKYAKTTIKNGIVKSENHNSHTISAVDLENVVTIEHTTPSSTSALEKTGDEVTEKQDTILFQEKKRSSHNGFGYIRRFHPITTTTTTQKPLIPEALVEIKSSITEPILSDLSKMIPTVVAEMESKSTDNVKTVMRNIEYPDIVLDPNAVMSPKSSDKEENKNFIIPDQKNSLINTWIKDLYNFSKTDEQIKNGDEDDDIQIGFQSLFKVPNIKGKSNADCPKNFRRNHHGKCVRPVKIRITIIEEEVEG